MTAWTPEKLAKARELCEAATRALCEAATPEWFLYSEPEVGLPVDVFCRTADGNIRPMQDSQQDLEFAISARILLPEALDEIERLRQRVDALEQRLEITHVWINGQRIERNPRLPFSLDGIANRDETIKQLEENISRLRRALTEVELMRGRGAPCTACGHIIDWQDHCACDDEYLGIRGGKDAERTALDLHEAKCEIEGLRAENIRLLAFAGAVLDLSQRSNWSDVDGAALGGLFLEHGLRVQGEATEADCAEEWAQEWGLEPGDPIHKLTDLGRRAREARQ